MNHVRLAGVGAFVPPNRVDSNEIETRLGLDPGWIEQRTGILSRPVAAETVATSDLAIEAGREALSVANVQPSDIGMLLLATSTPDHLLPPTAPLVAHRLMLHNAGAIDLAGACSGFLYALTLGSSHAQATQSPVLIIAANILSRRINPYDPSTVSLFGDGAGAVVLVPSSEPTVLGVYLGADGAFYDSIFIPAGGTRDPMTIAALGAGHQFIAMKKGPAVFRKAAQCMADAGQRAMFAANLRPQHIDWWIPHQANLRLIRETGHLLDIPWERTVSVVDRYANSSAASIPIALAEAIRRGNIERDNLLLLTAVGAGLTSAAIVLKG
jgi:3-oxoacyl-[acyl-carrier-protein] synthase-3